MADLTDDHKFEIVSMLACFHEPSSVIARFQADHGIKLDRKQVGRYHPQRSYYAGGDKWRAIFDAQRQAFLNDVSTIPIAHLGYRLRMLQEGLDAARAVGNWPLALKLLEQAAKEMGGIYTSKRTIELAAPARNPEQDMSPVERRAAVQELLRSALERASSEKAALAA